MRWKLWRRWLRVRIASTSRRDVLDFGIETALYAFAFTVIAAWCFHG